MSGVPAKTLLLSCYACAPATGTEPGFGWFTSRHLAAAGHRVHVLTRAGNRSAIESPSADPHPRVTFHYVRLPPALRFLKEAGGPHYLLWQVAALVHARRLLRAANVDIVHHVTYGSLQGGSLLWALGRPFFFGPAGGGQMAPPQARRYFGTAWRQERLRSALTGLLTLSPLHHVLACRATRMYATNAQTARLMTRLGAKRVQLMLDSGVPDDLIASAVPARTDGALKILWVGRLLRRKALRLALESVAELTVPVHLTVVGDGPDREEVPGWIEELGLQGRVSVLGRVSWAQVMALYREQDVFLFTSMRDSFGSQLLEAASQGLPIVCLDHQGAGDFLPEGAALKVPLRGADTLATDVAAALTRFATLTDAQRRAMGEAALTFARHHRWAEKADRYLRDYGERVGA
ncbi:hypothetical protein GCM10017781_10800 [Deinococcus metalli]|uniref:Glycosyltransferase family 4 protein n=1 Tax=Deinococcus metalli TaxID=1141878 RepID=A0ABQ3JJ44_9DEIO|nr:hypothetical protein GCM10017781_10800 [Deinococcus metalli]